MNEYKFVLVEFILIFTIPKNKDNKITSNFSYSIEKFNFNLIFKILIIDFIPRILYCRRVKFKKKISLQKYRQLKYDDQETVFYFIFTKEWFLTEKRRIFSIFQRYKIKKENLLSFDWFRV